MNFQVRDWPSVILHIDGDSFFASVIQSVRPELRGKPLVTGSERGVATAISAEAKKLGVTRALPIFQIKKRFPQVIVVSSDYDLIHLYSKRMTGIVRKYSPTVEEYSVDEAFADLKGLRRPLNMTYQEIAAKIKQEVESSLGITVSVGVSLTKSLAKIASGYRKPSGLVLIPGRFIQNYLGTVAIKDVWGIGPNTSAYLKKLGIKTALDFAQKPEEFVLKHLSKPFFEIWSELRGDKVYSLDTDKKSTYQSITRSHTFKATTNRGFLWSRVVSHVEDAFLQARQCNYHVGAVSVYLKTQQFRYHHKEIKLIPKMQYPHLIKNELKAAFDALYQTNVLYRTAGCTIGELEETTMVQGGLFEDMGRQGRIKKVYPLIESGKVHFGSSLHKKRQLWQEKPTHFTIPMMNIKDL